jgi:uncharacterized protein (DUF736 family)
MNIGEMIRSENGGVNGYIAEAGFDFDGIFLEKVASDNPRAPLFNLMTKSPRGRDVRLGSIWERAAKETGETYFGGYIDTAQSGFVPIRMFRSRQQDNVWNIVRPTAQRRREGRRSNSLPRTFAGMPWSGMPSSPTMIVTTSARAGPPGRQSRRPKRPSWPDGFGLSPQSDPIPRSHNLIR